MESDAPEIKQQPASEVPEDVAILFSWANLHDAQYRDFSGARRAFRAQLRHKAAERVRAEELTALAEAPPSRPPSETATAPSRVTSPSSEPVLSRSPTLPSVFDPPPAHAAAAEPVLPSIQRPVPRPPMLAVFSLAGGVGKTSLVATLGCILCALGEHVLLADTTSHGLLPFYFGTDKLRPEVVRTFSPPVNSAYAPLSLVSYEVDQHTPQTRIADQLRQHGHEANRILVDLTGSSAWVIRHLVRTGLRVLIPLTPDRSSVLSLQAIEKLFESLADDEGRAIQPTYLLNQVDIAHPLHREICEELRRKLGDRLLPFVIRRSPAVSEAFAEGRTVVDYAPHLPIVEDYRNVATWLRMVSPPAPTDHRNARRSEP